MSEYTIADEVKIVAESLIRQYHQHLSRAKITYLFRDQAWKTRDGMVILGRASKRSKIDKLLSREQEDFIVIIGRDKWDKLNDEEKRALVDHELCHCGVIVSSSGEMKWILRSHPIEEFPEILARYEFKRQELGNLIQNPPSPIIDSEKRRIR